MGTQKTTSCGDIICKILYLSNTMFSFGVSENAGGPEMATLMGKLLINQHD
jgi:hypothetical protein